MLHQLYNLFESKKKPEENRLKVELKYHVDYGNSSAHGYGGPFDIDDSLADNIKKRIITTPGKNPVINILLILTGYWDGALINEKFTDLNTLQNYLFTNAMLPMQKKVIS